MVVAAETPAAHNEPQRWTIAVIEEMFTLANIITYFHV